MITEAIAAVGNAIAKFFGYSTQRDADNNSTAMQQGATLSNEQAAQDQVNKDIAAKNTEAIRKDLADS